MRQNRTIIILIAAWLGLIAAGFGAMASYAAKPGAVGDVPQTWPEDAPASMTLDPEQPTLVLAVHPRCPCTRATINELERALAKAPALPTTYALIFEPAPNDPVHQDESFARTHIANRLAKLPAVTLIPDPGAEIATRFGALTSGHTLVYTPDADLAFSGGLTPTRAHEGPNTGSASLIELFNARKSLASEAPVFGCPLCPNDQTDSQTDTPTPAMATCSPTEDLP
jgi:hypothetical protein